MRILVFGAGAVGSALGGLLAQSGHDVTLLGRPDHMQAIRERGLRIEGIWGEHHIERVGCIESATELTGRAFDVIVLTVKSYDTSAAIEVLGRLSESNALILSVQNGFGNTQALERAFGNGRVLGARIITGVELPAPGRVVVTVSADDIRLGPPAGEAEMMEAALRIVQVFRDSGIPTAGTDRYREFLWAKILYNCALNPLGALLRATYGELASDQGTRQLIDRIIEEAFSVARSHNIALFWRDPEEYRSHFYAELIPPTAQHYPSMLRDLEKRGRTEIDALNGAVLKLADEAGIAAPVNQTLTHMIKLREQTRRAELKMEE
jgi:2-dehydropantoate 2-reductase